LVVRLGPRSHPHRRSSFSCQRAPSPHLCHLEEGEL